MEQKLFMEKNKMEMEATRKIAQYAEKAQKEAIAAMTETTRKVFKDNVTLSDAMKTHLGNFFIEQNFEHFYNSIHSARTEQLEVENEKLKKQNKRLKNEVEINEVTVKEKVTETRKAKDKILTLTSRLEESQGQLIQFKAQSEAKNQLVLANVRFFYEFDRIMPVTLVSLGGV